MTTTPTPTPRDTREPKPSPNDPPPMYTIPITDRPPHGPLFSKVFFPLLFNFGQIGINSAQFLAVPLLLVPVYGRGWFEGVVGWTKDGYGRLLIAITVLFAPTSLIITTDTPPDLANLVERDNQGRMTRINLPDRLVVMANHQAYTDWMYLWILACYSGNSRGVVILLKAALKNIPIVGWGMRFFKFIFLNRSWAADRANLTKALTDLGKRARGSDPSRSDEDEHSSLLASTSGSGGKGVRRKRSPLWLFIFPEGTITSDEERVKSKRYADKEGISDFVTMLHPRSTGLLFILRTLLPEIPDLKLLDVTIGYPGVPYGKYPQDWYGLISIFFRSVPPPTVHLHLHLHQDIAHEIPSLITKPLTLTEEPSTPVSVSVPVPVPETTGVASPEEAREFELWLRTQWEMKEKRMEGFYKDQKFVSAEGGDQAREVVKIRQVRWWDWIGAVGGGGIITVTVVGVALWKVVQTIR